MTSLTLVRCDHEGRCSGRLRFDATGALIRQLVCDDCGALVQTLGITPYLIPRTERRAA